jgi:hypothetical protein
MPYQIIVLRVLLPLHKKLRPAGLNRGSSAFDSRRAEHQRFSGGYIFPDDVTLARLPLPSSFLVCRLPGRRVPYKHNAHVSPKQSDRR